MNTLDLSTLPVWVLVVGGIVGVAQLAFEIWTLLRMLQTPEDRLTLGGRKWLWAIIILFVNWIGAILFWAVGRKPEMAVEVAPQAPASSRAQAAADALYGEGDEASER